MKKAFLLFLLLLPFLSMGQDWASVQQLLDSRQYATADKQAAALFRQAQRAGDSRQMLLGAYFLSQAEHAYKEYPADSSLARYQALLPQLRGAERTLCLALMDSLPQALEDSMLLQQTLAEEFREMLSPKPLKEEVNVTLTPTLYDVLVWERMNKATREEREQLVASLRHLHRNDTCLLVEIELAYADHLSRFDREEHYRRALNQYGSASCDHYTLLHYHLANHLREQGEMRYLEAIALCDSAAALAPKSEGGQRAQRLKEELLAPKVSLYTHGNDQMSQRHLLALAEVRNVQQLHFRLCSAEGIVGKEKSVLKAKTLQEWTQATHVSAGDPTAHLLYVYLPPLPAGKYVLLASHDGRFAKDHVVWLFFDCTDMVLLPIEGNPARPEGYLLDRATGHPIAHQEVTLYISTGRNQYRDLYTTRTDSDGHYTFAQHEQELSQLIQKYRRSPNAKVFYQGRWHGEGETSYYYGNGSAASAASAANTGLFYLDQPIYRPGDTVRFALLAYRGDGRQLGEPLAGRACRVLLCNDRGERLDTLDLTLDSFGTAHGFFPLPATEGVGSCLLSVDDAKGGLQASKWVPMEHYKQPKFEVLLDPNSTEPAFGLPYQTEGTAAAYSGAPIDGAEVRWSVVRSEHYPWWRWREGKSPVCVAQGSLRTDLEGRFAFDFIPTPDSSVELRERPNFIYTITVQVTDLNGETHEAQQSFLLGFDSGELLVDDRGLTFQTLDGKPLEGEVHLRIEELEPVAPRIRPTFDGRNLSRQALDTLHHTLTPHEFASRFPLYPYQKEEPRVRALVKDTLMATSGSTSLAALYQPLAKGRYLVSASTVGRLGDTIRAEHTLLVGESDGLLYMHYADGMLTLDSRFDSMEVRLLVSVRDSVLSCQRLVLNQETRRIPIAITPEMKGGFRIQALTFKENTLLSHSEEVPVPYKDKQLSLSLTTFRDRLAPGSEEQWTLHVADWKQNPVRANALMTMYDAALDTYDHLNWRLNPWHDNYNSICFTQPSMSIRNSTGRLYRFPDLNVKSWQAPCWRIARPSVDFMYGFVYAAKAQSRNLASMDMAMVNEEVELEVEAVMTDASTGASDSSGDTEIPAPQPRTNFSPLAFFRPTLRTDSLGNADITFRVPDLLTRWSIRGLAWTQEMCYGSLQEQAVTQKELMVQVNKPRFLRLGDSVQLSAKITNMTDEALCAFVELEYQSEGMGCFSDIPAHSSAMVSFPLKADSLGLLEYTLTASTPHHSDGERDAIAVLPTRQRVTESMAMYLNGTGEKDYLFSHLLHSDTSSTLQHDSLSLEWVNDPIELAIAAFPHLKEQENPSNIYRFNAYYCNRLAERLHIPSDPAADDLSKLLAAQRPDGGWSWIPGGEESSLWTTTYILTGLGRLGEENREGLAYVDNEEYKLYEKYYKKSKHRCEPSNIAYLYMRTLFGRPSGKAKEMYDFYYANARRHALEFSGLYSRAQLALTLYRGGDKKLAQKLVEQLKECALTSDEMGMYWRDNRSGLCWTDRPIEVQALLIEAFRTITPQDTESVALMQQWLLKQKQTTRWESDVATAHAITALVGSGRASASSQEDTIHALATLVVGADTLHTTAVSATFHPSSVSPAQARVHISRRGEGPAWGAMHWSYYEEMDKIPASEMGIQLRRTLYRVEADGRLVETTTFRVGDRLRVRIDIECDRTLDQLELRDPRAAACEPLSTANGWHWNQGLRYYNYISNDATLLYIDRLQKGKYQVEYDLYLTAAGHFSLPPCQCSSLYAPAFRALAPAMHITVSPSSLLISVTSESNIAPMGE